MNETNFGALFLATGGSLVFGALICLLAGTIGLAELAAAMLAAYGVLTVCNSMDRAEQRARK